ncbi:MAG: ribonuclease Z [Flavobacteriales bacterium]|nr:ribonuclease Z [Flavobacteriales bacterium]
MDRGPFTLTTLGTGAALPARGRYPTSQILDVHGMLHLIDCGEGTQERMRGAGISFQRIAHVHISHMHGDHYLGLMGLISSMHLMGRRKELFVHGPKELKEVVDIQLRASGTYLRYPLRFRSLPHVNGHVVHADEHVTVTTLALKHRIPCTGFLFKESVGLRGLRREQLHRIPQFKRAAVKAGHDLEFPDGARIPNAELTLDPESPRSYAYCSDTAYEPDLVPHLEGVDLLYHEATFTEAMAGRAKETYHSTAADAARIAAAAGVGRLLLGHFSSRYKSPDPLLTEALGIFPRTVLSHEGGVFPVRTRDGA